MLTLKKIFEILIEKKYKDRITFDSVRGASPFRTASYNLLYFKRLIKKL